MTTPRGVFTKELVDIGTIFKPYTSGTKVLNQFFTKDSQDIGNLLQPKPAGKTQSNIGMSSRTQVDIGTLYEQYNLFTPIGTFTSATSGGYTIFRFTGNGNIVSLNPSGQTVTVYYLIVGGGGAGGFDKGGGGGAGGLLQDSFTMTSTDTITVSVGSGGTSGASAAIVQANGRGGNSSITFLTNTSNNKTADGGGYGGSSTNGLPGNGGSSGGSGNGTANTNTSTPTPQQGNIGGSSSSNNYGGGGGGAGGGGGIGSTIGGSGGLGKLVSINQLGIYSLYPTTSWAGGGGGGGNTPYTPGPNYSWETIHPTTISNNIPNSYTGAQAPYDNQNVSSSLFTYASGNYIITFQLGTRTESNWDFFYIRNGSGVDLITKMSGTSWPQLQVSSSNGIRFSYTTDGTVGFYGIKLILSDGGVGGGSSTTGGPGGSGGGGGGGPGGAGGTGLNNGSTAATIGGNGGANTGGGGGGGGTGVSGGNGGSGIVILAVATSILA
jgi:hypothetical protein